MSVSLTPKQIAAIQIRLTAKCTEVQIGRWPVGKTVEVSQFDRQRLIEAVKISPSGNVKVL